MQLALQVTSLWDETFGKMQYFKANQKALKIQEPKQTFLISISLTYH